MLWVYCSGLCACFCSMFSISCSRLIQQRAILLPILTRRTNTWFAATSPEAKDHAQAPAGFSSESIYMNAINEAAICEITFAVHPRFCRLPTRIFVLLIYSACRFRGQKWIRRLWYCCLAYTCRSSAFASLSIYFSFSATATFASARFTRKIFSATIDRETITYSRRATSIGCDDMNNIKYRILRFPWKRENW